MEYPRPLIRDISKYDAPPYNVPPIHWEDYDAFIIRCFDGTDDDPIFNEHRAKAISYGKAWIPYSFYDFRVPAIGQIEKALAILGDNRGHAPLCLDVEEWGIFKFPERSILLNGMKVLHDSYLSITGLKPTWYFSSVAVIHEHLIPVPAWLLACPLWAADWRSMHPEYDPWKTWTLHQYQGDPDLNQFNGTVDDFCNWLLVPPPTPLPPELPEYIIPAYTGIRLRNEPTDAKGDLSVVGYSLVNKKLYPEDIVLDEKNREWYKLGKRMYIAKWLTRLP